MRCGERIVHVRKQRAYITKCNAHIRPRDLDIRRSDVACKRRKIIFLFSKITKTKCNGPQII